MADADETGEGLFDPVDVAALDRAFAEVIAGAAEDALAMVEYLGDTKVPVTAMSGADGEVAFRFADGTTIVLERVSGAEGLERFFAPPWEVHVSAVRERPAGRSLQLVAVNRARGGAIGVTLAVAFAGVRAR